MSTFSRPHSPRQIRHPAARSASHRADKAAAEARKESTTIRVPTPALVSPVRPFSAFGIESHEAIFDGENWRSCEGSEEFADYLEEKCQELSWFTQHTHRAGKPAKMRRKTPTPLEVITVTCPPWLSDWVFGRLASGQAPTAALEASRDALLDAAFALFEGKRHLLGYAFHADTYDLHFDLIVSRQDGQGGRIGESGLHLAGPWTVGVDRQLRAGAEIGADKERNFERNIGKFRARYGVEAVPLDVALARALDEGTEKAIGIDLAPFKSAYALGVPAQERAHQQAALQALEDAKRKLLGEDVESPEVPL